jgi:hypothetical protein
MKPSIILAAAGASLASARAAPLPSGVARSVIDDQGAVEQARWVRCQRPDGRGGHGSTWRRGRDWGHRRHGGWGHFHLGGQGHGHGHGHGGHHR